MARTMRATVRLLYVAMAMACGLHVVEVRCQSPTPDRCRAPHRDPRIEALVTDAMTIPSEFASEALLRIAGSGLVTDPEWRREMLETAYMRAYDAQESYRRTSVGIPPDTRQGAMTLPAESPLHPLSPPLPSTPPLPPHL